MFDHINFFISFIAGVVSFLSPCVFPLVPSFLFYLGGDASQRIQEQDGDDAHHTHKRILLLRTLFFVCGFTVVFVVLGYIFSSAGILLGQLSVTINIVAGSLIILLGLHQLFNIFRFLQFDLRANALTKVQGNFSALVAGIAFGAGWSPCIGPLLTSILLLASQSATARIGVVYLSLYGIGLGLPFILIATCIPFKKISTLFKRHAQTIKRVSGIMLVVIGLLVLLGRWRLLNTTIVYFGTRLQQFPMHHPAVAYWGTLAGYVGIASAFGYRMLVLLGVKKIQKNRGAAGRGVWACITDEIKKIRKTRGTKSESATVVAHTAKANTATTAKADTVTTAKANTTTTAKADTTTTSTTPYTPPKIKIILNAFLLLSALLCLVLESAMYIDTITFIGHWFQFQGI